MHNWTPNMQDVRWNYDAANQAIAALRRAADILDETTNERVRAAHEASNQWQGVYRKLFDTYHADEVKEARTLAMEYREAARRIAQGSHQAQQEQASRVRARDRWRREAEEEERLRQMRNRPGRA